MSESTPSAVGAALPHERIAFAHNSERQLAKLLDFSEVEWHYKPRTFVLESGADALPTLAFSPDFYLPGFDRYIEVTPLNQKLVTKKNRKVRMLQERHPDVRVRLLYQRDYLEVLVKYGLEPPDQLPCIGSSASASAGERVGLLGLGALPRPAASRGERQEHPAA